MDMLAHSFCSQENPGDYELVIVDGYKERVEEGLIVPALKNVGIKVGWYGPPKEKLFNWSRTGFANAMNTGLIHSTGSHVVFIHDYTLFPMDMIAKWRQEFSNNPKTLIHGWGVQGTAPEPDTDEHIRTWKNLYDVLGKIVWSKEWIPTEFEIGYIGGPMEYFELTNGIDERSDFCSIWALNSLLKQARFYGYKLLVSKELKSWMIVHSVWKGDPNNEYSESEFRMRGALQDIREEPKWTKWSANDFHLAQEQLATRLCNQ